MGHFTGRQWTILAMLYVSIVFIFIPVGILLPFYPVLAMSKGAMPVHLGFVFGVFRLMMCLGSPVLGKLINHIGTRFMFIAGFVLVGGCSILMGIIKHIVDTTAFLYASYAIQSVAGLGTVMTAISATTLVNKEFPDDMGAVFGGIEIAVGLGQVLGPLLAGGLSHYEGFTLPFVLFGSIILLLAVLDFFLLPGHAENTIASPNTSNPVTLISILRLPIIIIFITSLLIVCLAFGFFMGTYEIHLEPLNLTPFQVSSMFSMNSVMFCTSSWFAGCVSDKFLSPLIVSLVGAIFTVVSFLLLGPAPFLPIPYNISLAVIANILFGIGNGTQVVATFSGMGRSTIASGLPNTLTTHGLVCGLWNFCFSLGCFIGFIVGGVLLQAMGYQWASTTVAMMEFLVVTIITIFLFSSNCHPPESTCDKTQGLQSDGQELSCARNIEHSLTNSVSLSHSNSYGSVHKRISIKVEI